jgi:hypothetical protein
MYAVQSSKTLEFELQATTWSPQILELSLEGALTLSTTTFILMTLSITIKNATLRLSKKNI